MRRITFLVIAGLGVALGVWEAISCAAIPSAYAADYALGFAFFFTIALVMIGALLAIYWRTRSVGVGFIAAGVLSYVIFYAGITVLGRMNRVAWRREPRAVPIEPTQQSSIVTHFRSDVTARDIDEFNSSVLRDTSGRFPPFVRYYAVSRDTASGRIVLVLRVPSTTAAEVAAYLAKIKSDRRVESVEASQMK